MFTLFQHAFCPHSRFVRLVLGEYGFDVKLVEERVWERREAYLALNPAGIGGRIVSIWRPADDVDSNRFRVICRRTALEMMRAHHL